MQGTEILLLNLNCWNNVYNRNILKLFQVIPSVTLSYRKILPHGLWQDKKLVKSWLCQISVNLKWSQFNTSWTSKAESWSGNGSSLFPLSVAVELSAGCIAVNLNFFSWKGSVEQLFQYSKLSTFIILTSKWPQIQIKLISREARVVFLCFFFFKMAAERRLILTTTL